jgi:signal transduction histidine kinase
VIRRLWPGSLRGQLLLAIALALLVAQALSAALVYRAQAERREAALVASAAFRLAGGPQRERGPARRPRGDRLGIEVAAASPQRAGETRRAGAEQALGEMLTREGLEFDEVVVVERAIADDPSARRWLARRHGRMPRSMRAPPHDLIVAAIHRPDGRWVHARVLVPGGERNLLRTMLLQALFTYAVLVGAVWWMLGRITRPLAALTRRMERFAGTRDGAAPLEPEGPDDVRALIAAHNALEARIAGLLDEKDVMLGAIGHDLKTPLAALRVRIESVEDDAERAKMAATIEDIARSLDDILTLARVGRPSDPLEPTELGALAASVVEEYEDRGEPVTLASAGRIVLPLRATWLRRLLRNLIDNALRYGGAARVSLAREAGAAVIRIDDDGPGIPESEIARMMEPFTRLEASRNTGTGGAGLGLTLARAIAEQHGGTLTLANRPGGGLSASLSLPLI